MNAKQLAEKFHNRYEALAPAFGYQTRKETRAFDPRSPNGQLMIAVCGEMLTIIVDEIADILKAK